MAITSGSVLAVTLLDDAPSLTLHSQFATGVNLACAGYLVHAGLDPHGGPCSLGVDEADLQLLRGAEQWRWTGERLVARDGGIAVELDPAAELYTVEPPGVDRSGLDAKRLARARQAHGSGSWLECGIGLEIALPRLRAAIDALLGRGPVMAVREVIGLGAGLTPSADDALVGALCVLAATGTALPTSVRALDEWLLGEGATATTDVSANYLRLALQGAFSTPLSRTVAALPEAVPEHLLADALRELATVGATSGLDAAVGIQLVCESLTPAVRAEIS